MGKKRVGNGESYKAPFGGAEVRAVTNIANTDIGMVREDGTVVFAPTPYQDLVGHQTQRLAIEEGWTITVSGGATQHASVSDGD